MKSSMIFRYIKNTINNINKYGFIKTLKRIKNTIHIVRANSKFNNNYYDWIKNNEPNNNKLEKQRKHKFEVSPKISILIPLYHTDEIFFGDLVKSLKKQTYQNFEVCMADGSETINRSILSLFEEDKRFKYVHLKQNKGISDNTNKALEMATGEYIALLDHDDVLPLFSLFEVVKAINQYPDVEYMYSDEDILDSYHKRKNPHFKPDYSPDTLRSYNYMCHFSVFRKELLNKIGGFKKEFDGAQDYDLILRATEYTNKIVHIPMILYHWRAHQNSTSQNVEAKSYAFVAGEMALKSHLERIGLKGTVNSLELPGTYRIQYTIEKNPKVSIIIPNKDATKELKKCINSIQKSTYSNFEIIIVENNSSEETIFKYYDELRKFNNISIIQYGEMEFNFSKLNNFGRKAATGKYLILLNNDVEIISNNWIEEMLGLCQRPDVGIVGTKLLYFDNTVQHAGVILGMGGIAGHIHKMIKDSDQGYFSRANIVNNFSAVTAACLMVKTSIFDRVNGLSEEFKVAFNDIDLCMKVREIGYLIVYTPFSKLYHYESKTRGLEDTVEKQVRFANEIKLFKERWKKELDKGDPYFNKNFRLDSSLFIIDVNKK